MLEGYLNERDDAAKAAASQAKRDGAAPAEAPDAMVAELLADIGERFYRGKGAKRWAHDQKPLMMVLTWPATWLRVRGVSLPVARYREIMREIITEIARHGDMAKIEYFPGYLQQCVRLWWVHNGEEVYERQKSIRNALDMALLKGATKPATAPDPMEALAAAHRVLVMRKAGPKSARKADDSQLTML